MADAQARERLARLLEYVKQDPDNAALLRDAAEAALEADDPAQAKLLYAHMRDVGELDEADTNLWAIAAMRSGDPELAAETFAGLLDQRPDDHALRFNLAWARSLAGDDAGAREALDEQAAEQLPQAALLDVQLLHRGGEFERAAERARHHLLTHGDYPPLLAAASTLALDIEDEQLARDCAERAPDHPEAMTTLATLALGEQRNDAAKRLFERSLELDPGSPRAWIGLGIAELLAGNPSQAASHMERGAETFGIHLGSWVAAGWARLLAGELPQARQHFERAVELDGSFAEAQGSLALTDLLEGKTEEARHKAEVALRLDRQSFAAAFVTALLSAGAGDADTARRIMEIALIQPVDGRGKTLAEAIARMGR